LIFHETEYKTLLAEKNKQFPLFKNLQTNKQKASTTTRFSGSWCGYYCIVIQEEYTLDLAIETTGGLKLVLRVFLVFNMAAAGAILKAEKPQRTRLLKL